MRSFAPRLMKLAATVILFTAADAILFAADQPNQQTNQYQLPPSKRNAPKGQRLEFSAASSTAPELPKPTPRATELQNRQAIGSDSAPPVNGIATIAPSQAPQVSRALAERMLQQLDRRKNWMVPGAQDAEFDGMISDWMKQGFDKNGKETDEEKNESVMERFLKGSNEKNKSQQKHRLGEQNDPNSQNDNSRDEKGLSNRDPKVQETTGLADFSLKSALSADRKDGFAPMEMNRQNMFRNDFNPDNRTGRERELAREREATRAAEFQQLISPRSGGATFSSITDPINSAPDLTRREINPILPRAAEPAARPEGNAFGAPQPARSFGAQDRGLFGVTVPTTPNFNPTPAAPPVSAPIFRPATSIILEPPKRPY